jgi:uncharacterized membrane protein YkoI
MRKPFLIALLAGTSLCATLVTPVFQARADDDRHEDDGTVSRRDDEQRERDLIMEAVRRGEILPLPKLKSVVLERWPGELVALKVDREDGKIRYEFRILRPDGRLTEVEVDAADGAILEVENE